MKKLLVVVAALTIAAVAQASSFKWTAANVYGADGTTKFTGTAEIYAYLSTATLADAVKVVDAYVVGGTFKSDAVGTANGFTYEWADAVGDKPITSISSLKMVERSLALQHLIRL